MREAQFVFVTQDARVMAMDEDGLLEDVTETRELLPRCAVQGLEPVDPLRDTRRALVKKFAS